MDKDKPTIGMLLDIEHLYGEHEGRLAPVLMTILLCLAAPLLYVYFGLFNIIPIWLFAPIAIIIAIYVVLLIPGRQNYRVKMFKRRLNDEYTSVADLMNIVQIRDDGLVVYPQDIVFYAVCCYNGTVENELSRTQELRKFLNTLLGEFEFDTYIMNVNNTEPLRQYYSKTHQFGKNDAGRNFVRIIDNTVKLTKENSMVQCTVYCIKGRLSDWKQIRTQIDSAIRSSSAKCFKTVYRVTDPETLHDIIDMDADTNVNVEELLRRRYQTGEYGSSKVLAYDTSDEIVIQAKTEIVEQQVKSNKSFYVGYKETSIATSASTTPMVTAKPDYYTPVVVGKSNVEERQSGEEAESSNSRKTKRQQDVQVTKKKVSSSDGKEQRKKVVTKGRIVRNDR